MLSPVTMISMIAQQQFGKGQIERIQEPSQLTDAQDNVLQYDQVMTTKLVLAYAIALETIYRATDVVDSNGRAIDIACGPGHFTLCLARYFKLREIVGIDLAEQMVSIGNNHVVRQGLQDRVRFACADAVELSQFETDSFELTCFNDAAHHMPDIFAVRKVLREMERLTCSDGLVLVMDLVRLRTRKLTEQYVNELGRDYKQKGLGAFFEDFRNSMFAAWTVDELRRAIPIDTNRYWCHLVSRGLPAIQVILGLPIGRSKPYIRRGVPWRSDENPVSKSMRFEWWLARQTFLWAKRTLIAPKITRSNNFRPL